MSGRRGSNAAASGLTATYHARFSPRPHAPGPGALGDPAARLPSATRLLVLAHKIDGLIRAGDIRNWSEAARLAGVTRARMTQIANLLLLAPDIQEAITTVERLTAGHQPLWERHYRVTATLPEWQRQRQSLHSEASKR